MNIVNEKSSRPDLDRAGDVPAEEYENKSRKSIPGYDGLYSLAQILLAEDLPDKAEILVVGAGGGKEVTTFGKAFSNATLTGVDPSEKTLGASCKVCERQYPQCPIRRSARCAICACESRSFSNA